MPANFREIPELAGIFFLRGWMKGPTDHSAANFIDR